MTWTEAKACCESMGGHLVVIEAKEEQDFLTDFVSRAGARNLYWIGLEVVGEGWEWITGNALEYDNWAVGEPNEDFGGTELCCQMYARDCERGPDIFYAGEWNDSRDDGGTMDFWRLENTGFVCEWEMQA